MRLLKCSYLLFGLIGLNLIFLCILMHNQKSDLENVLSKQESLDVTIILVDYENFDNNVEETVRNIEAIYEGIPILVVAPSIPYPYFHLPARNAKLVITKTNLLLPKHMSDPMHYVKTKYILVIPDSSKIKFKGAIEELVWLLRTSKTSQIITAPLIASGCVAIDIDLKIWSLTYRDSSLHDQCNGMIHNSALLFEKNILQNFTETFSRPFFHSFYIQARLRNLKMHVTDGSYFDMGRILFANNHFKWKHDEQMKIDLQKMYQRFGIKRVVNKGIETMYGCTKTTTRCFPSVLDIPFYLYEGRWTPPCCLNALRETARYVFKMLETWNVKYWLEGGSLLGAARYGDIIPWDYDVDLGILLQQINKSSTLESVWNGAVIQDHNGFVWEKAKEGEFIRVQYSKTNHLHVDIFPFYEKNGVMTKNTWFKTHRQDTEFPAHFIKPVELITFVGVLACAPNNHQKFLELKFGKGAIENPQYPFPEKLLNVKNLKLHKASKS